MARNILVVEDDRNISELIRMYLEKEGFEVRLAYDGGKAVEEYDKRAPDMVLLDIMLPVMDGWAVCAHIREKGKTPIIMLTAKSDVGDRITGLEMGADDYLVKPFGVMEMVSRVKAVLRRCHPADTGHVLSAGGLSMDLDCRTVTADGQRLQLTYKEFELLRLFLSHPGMAFTREQLFTQVWNMEYMDDSRTLDMHIKTLRKKLGEAGSMIKTVRNVGYIMSDKEN